MVYILKNTRKDFRKRMEDRTKILEVHKEGKLSNSFYSVDKKTGKKYLSPHKLFREGY